MKRIINKQQLITALKYLALTVVFATVALWLVAITAKILGMTILPTQMILFPVVFGCILLLTLVFAVGAIRLWNLIQKN